MSSASAIMPVVTCASPCSLKSARLRSRTRSRVRRERSAFPSRVSLAAAFFTSGERTTPGAALREDAAQVPQGVTQVAGSASKAVVAARSAGIRQTRGHEQLGGERALAVASLDEEAVARDRCGDGLVGDGPWFSPLLGSGSVPGLVSARPYAAQSINALLQVRDLARERAHVACGGRAQARDDARHAILEHAFEPRNGIGRAGAGHVRAGDQRLADLARPGERELARLRG